MCVLARLRNKITVLDARLLGSVQDPKRRSLTYIPIFDTYHPTNGIFVNCEYLDVVSLFGDSFKYKRGISGFRIAFSTFDNVYFLANIH